MALNQSYFSRPGRSSSKTLKILKGGYLSLMASHEMLKGKGITISELNKISEKSTTKDPKKVAVIDEIYNIKKKKHHKKRWMNLSSSFKVQSRDDYGKSHNLKESTLSPGHYNLNFSQIEKNIPRHKIGKSLSHVFQFPRDLNKSDLLLRSESHEKRKRIPGISFEKQSNRVLHIKDTTVPNENRFTVLNLLPRVSSKYKNNSVPDLSKYLPRSSDLFKVPEYSPCYSPNKEFVLPKLVPTFKFKPITRKRKLRSSNVSPISFSHGAENLDEVLKTYSDSPTCKTRAQHTYSLNSSWLPCNKGFLENKSFKSTNDSVELSGNFYL